MEHVQWCIKYPLYHRNKNFMNNIIRLGQPNFSVKCLAHESYIRDFRILQRIRVAHTYLLSKIWCGTQILLIPDYDTHQINSLMTLCILAGEIFLVPYRLSNYRRRKELHTSSIYRPNALRTFLVDAHNGCKPKTPTPLHG